jgi:hypothetical protein
MSSIFGEEFDGMFEQLDKLNEAAKPLKDAVEENQKRDKS